MKQVHLGQLVVEPCDVRTAAETNGWQIESFNFSEIWSQTKGSGVKVCVMDSGVDSSHPDLEIAGRFDFVGGANGAVMDVGYIPTASHGTHVCGIIGARSNGIGITGVAPECEIYSCRVLDEDGNGDWSDLEAALYWAIANKMDVINMSLGGGFAGETFYNAIRATYDANIPCVCAGGNDGWYYGYVDFPATYDETIAVAAINSSMTRSSFSSVGSNIDVAAPGEMIVSTMPNNAYAYMSGTSMATPFVTGLVALVLAKHRIYGGATPVKTVNQVREHITKTANDVSFNGQDIYYGFGIVNPESALVEEKPIAPKSSLGRVYGGVIQSYSDKPWL